MRKLIHGGDIYSKDHINDLLDLSANINPLGMPESVKRAIIDNIDSYMVYPDPLQRKLRKSLGEFYSIDEKYILCGNGAADIIFRIPLAIEPKNALILAPTFAEYEQALKITKTNILYYDLKEENKFEIKEDILNLITDDIDILFICNPNNPTGRPLPLGEMIKILDKCKQHNIYLVVDECFSDFLEEESKYSLVPYIKEYNNLIILKAFTKMYAMAGIRLGYALSSNEYIIDKICNAGQPWSISTIAEIAGIYALKEKNFVSETKKLISENREYLLRELASIGFTTYPSKVNYVLFKSSVINLKSKLEEHGILIRSCSNYRNLDKFHYRIAVKSKEDCERFINTLKEIIKDN